MRGAAHAPPLRRSTPAPPAAPTDPAARARAPEAASPDRSGSDDRSTARVRYFDHHFPIDPATLPPELELAQRDPSALPAAREWSAGEEGRARLRALLERQHYALDFWRNASRDVNYRRFFDVNELIALKVEDAEVFAATHQTVLQFVADGLVDGLRIDHIDGLLEPRRYLERLRAAVDARRPTAVGAARFPIVVEKV